MPNTHGLGLDMRPARLHELTLPTRYALWRKYIHGTELQNRIGPETFTDLLNQKQAIELVDQKGVTLCKVLNESKIQATLNELSLRPYQSFWPQLLSKLVKLANTVVFLLTSGTPRRTP